MFAQSTNLSFHTCTEYKQATATPGSIKVNLLFYILEIPQGSGPTGRGDWLTRPTQGDPSWGK